VGLKARPGVQRDPRQEPAFEPFVAESSTWLLRNAYLLTGERGASEDLLQLTLLRTVSRWRSAQRAPEAYARRVLVNLVRDRQRRAARRVVERPLEEAIGAGLSRDHADAMVGRDEPFDALARLSGSSARSSSFASGPICRWPRPRRRLALTGGAVGSAGSTNGTRGINAGVVLTA